MTRFRSNALVAATSPGSPSGSSATWSPTRTRPRSIRPMAMRPRKLEKSRVETSIWNGPSGSPLGGGTWSRMDWNSGVEIGARLLQLGGGRAGPARGIEERRVELLVGGLEVDEQAQHLVVHPERLGVGPVDLVDGDDGPEPERQRLPGDEPGLRHRPFGGIHQDQHPVHHPQDPLDLAAEIGVARRIDDVDLDAVPAHRGVLGEDGDAPLPLQRVRVHHPLFDLLVGAERPGLPEHLIDQRGLAVVDVGDDGQIPDQRALPYSDGIRTVEARTPGLRGAYID